MPEPFTQANRRLRIDTPLGADALLVTSLNGVEAMSTLFRFQVDLLAQQAVDFDAVIGEPVAVHLGSAAGDRHVHGIACRIAQAGVAGDLDRYTMDVVPRFWLATRTADCRIFQHKTVPDIVRQIAGEHEVELAVRLRGSYPAWDYCVQYRESDFDFVARLMEEEGIFFFFEHHADRHVLVLADAPSVHEAVPLTPSVRFLPDAAAGDAEDRVTWFRKAQEVRTGKWAVTDYDFEKPTLSLLTETAGRDRRQLEVYDFPGGGRSRDRLQGLAGLRQQEEDATRVAFDGSGHCRGLTPGYTVELAGVGAGNVSAFDGKYLVTSVRHRASESWGTGEGGGDFGYENGFQCIPSATPFRPSRRTPRPAIHGVQTAVVVGPSGEEIYTDEYGRVKVQFHWDREGGRNDQSSCWLRVATAWAGENWGMVSIPRIGQEVIVSFLEGDPDQPIIVGSVYNAGQMPPYALPANKTQSGLKSRSSKGGSPANFNEIRFEDKKGDEQLFIHAEKNQDIEVENDETHWVGRDRRKAIERDEAIHVKRDRVEQVDRNHEESIGVDMRVVVGGNLTEMVAVNYAETVGAAMELSVGAALAITVGGAMAESVGLAKTETVAGNRSLTVGKNVSQNIGQGHSLNVGKDQAIKVGGQSKTSVEKEFMLTAKKVQLVAQDEITIKAGSAEIVMKKNGDITLKGNKINLKASSDLVLKGSSIKEN